MNGSQTLTGPHCRHAIFTKPPSPHSFDPGVFTRPAPDAPGAQHPIPVMSITVLACDIGGTRIKLGLVRGRHLLARTEIPARRHEGLAAALHRVAKTAPVLLRRAAAPASAVAGLGLAFPGIIEPRSERILSTPAGKFDDATRLDVPSCVRRLLGLPLRVCNDANAALLGEWRHGAARGAHSVVMMTLGTGIGASAIINGLPLRGAHGQAGCLGGHLTFNLDGDRCPCGNLGCPETQASTWALPAQAKAHPHFPRSRLARSKLLDYAAVFKAAAQRDLVAIHMRDRAIRVWSATVVNLIHAYDPERVVVGGGVMRAGEPIISRLRRYVSQHAWTPWGKVKVLPAQLGNDAGMIGVATLFEDCP